MGVNNRLRLILMTADLLFCGVSRQRRLIVFTAIYDNFYSGRGIWRGTYRFYDNKKGLEINLNL